MLKMPPYQWKDLILKDGYTLIRVLKWGHRVYCKSLHAPKEIYDGLLYLVIIIVYYDVHVLELIQTKGQEI